MYVTRDVLWTSGPGVLVLVLVSKGGPEVELRVLR